MSTERSVPRRLGRDRSRARCGTNVAELARGRATGGAARGREGRRVRSRRGPDRARGARGRRDRGSVSRSSRRASRCARRASTHRSSCSPSRRRTPRRRWSRTDLTPVVYTTDGIDTLAKAVVERGTDEPLAGAPEGRHRHAPGRRVARARRWRSRSGSHQRTRAASRRCLHAPGRGRRARRSVHRRAARPLRRRTRGSRAPPGCARPLVHAANSAGLLAFPEARFDLVRVGIAIYGIAPAPELAGRVDAAARALAEGPGVAREDARRRRPRSPTGSATRCRVAGGSPRCRSATPTGCRATSPRSGGEVVVARSPPSDRRHRDDGPADGRRRRRRGRGR